MCTLKVTRRKYARRNRRVRVYDRVGGSGTITIINPVQVALEGHEDLRDPDDLNGPSAGRVYLVDSGQHHHDFFVLSIPNFRLSDQMEPRNGELSHNRPDTFPCRHKPEHECILADAITEEGCMLLEALLRTHGHGDQQFDCREYALQAALAAGAQDAVELILRWGAGIDLMGGFFETPLQAAIFGGHVGMVELVLQHGAAVDVETAVLSTPLLASITWGRHDIVSKLLEYGADVDRAAGRQQQTPLQLASAEGMPEIVVTLLDHGADVNMKGGAHGNAFQAAIATDHLSKEQVPNGVETNYKKLPNTSACDEGTTSRYLRAVSILADAIQKSQAH